MHSKPVSLLDLVRLLDDEGLSESYTRYVAGLGAGKQYRHYELYDIDSLIRYASLEASMCEDFLYGYEVPQLNKEFDLLRVGKERAVNIELKSQPKAIPALTRQLMQNHHYLKFLNRPIHCFVYVSSSKQLYRLEDNRLLASNPNELRESLKGLNKDDIDLDEAFSPSSILVSPIRHPERFLNGDYLLSENQSHVKKILLSLFAKKDSVGRYCSLIGGHGTGKTLLLYDLAKDLSKNDSVVLIQTDLSRGDTTKLTEALPNLSIIGSVNKITSRPSYVLVEDAHKLSETQLESIIGKAEEMDCVCLFSLDPEQRVYLRKENQKVLDRVVSLCDKNTVKLRFKIRINREMVLFASCLKDLGNFRDEYVFKNVRIIYEPNPEKADELASSLASYRYIRFAPIGKEIEKDGKSAIEAYESLGDGNENVVMVMNDNFYYEGNKLRSHKHPRLDYYYAPLLYQGISRVRNEFTLIVTERDLLSKVLRLFPARRS